MNEIYINVTVVDYTDGFSRCTLCQSVGNGPLEATVISRDHAMKLIWELVLAGGVRDCHTNWYNRRVTATSAYIFLPC